MKNQLSIKVTIADRVYPLTIAAEEEEGIRKAAENINAVVKEYQSAYAVKDKQDLVAMAALKFATEKLTADKNSVTLDQSVFSTLEDIKNNIEKVLA